MVQGLLALVPMWILLIGALLLAACGIDGTGTRVCEPRESGHKELPTSRPVWSDDGAEIAAMKGSYDLECFDDSWVRDVPTAHYENSETQIVLIEPATFVRRPFGPVISGIPRSVHHMRGAGGYLLITTATNPDVSKLMIWRMARDGTLIGADDPPEDWAVTRAVPSPDGNTIAVALRSTTSASTQGIGSAIWFLSSAQLQARRAPVPTASLFSDLTWTPSGELIVASVGSGAARVDPSGSVEVMLPRCFRPATTSSEIRSDGTRVTLEGGKLSYVFDEDSPGSGFGCQ